jgi:hypothetical protein
MKLLTAVRWACVGLWMVFASAHALPVLRIDANGVLTGAEGVEVGGTLYDVKFVDGSCVDLFSGCDEDTDFVNIALEQVVQQVFTPSVQGNFGHSPQLIKGCTDLDTCLVEFPQRFECGAEALAC